MVMLHSESPCAFLNPLDLLRYSPKPGAVPVRFAWLRQVQVKQNGGQLGNSSEICGFELIKHAQMFDHAPTGRREKTTRRDAENVSPRVWPHMRAGGAQISVRFHRTTFKVRLRQILRLLTRRRGFIVARVALVSNLA